MLAGLSGFNATFLADLTATENRITQLNKQITSGVRVSQASDDPVAIASILATQSDIDRTTQTQTNLQQASTVASSADGALASASSLLDQLRSLAAQGANSTATAATRATLNQQVQAIEQQLVSIANTQVEGRYIFGGDDPNTQPYTFQPGTFSAPAKNLNDPAARFDIGAPATDSESFSVTYINTTTGAVQTTPVSIAATASGMDGSTFVGQLNGALTTAGVAGVTAQIGADGTLQLTGSNLVSVTHTLTPGVTQGVAANNDSLTGVVQNNTAANTTALSNAAGSSIIPGMTAQQIFDARNPDGTPAAGNIFQAVYTLGQALLSNYQPGIQAAALALPASVTQLGQATTSYGNTQSWLAQATDDASSKLVNLHQVLGSLRDTDVAQAATDLTLANTAMQAALAAHGSMNVKSLFDYIG
jgi:flagellar hook-associated protein 3 FlgL